MNSVLSSGFLLSVPDLNHQGPVLLHSYIAKLVFPLTSKLFLCSYLVFLRVGMGDYITELSVVKNMGKIKRILEKLLQW